MRRLLNESIAPKLVLAVMGLAMAAPSWAQVAPALRLTDGINTVTIDSAATVTFSLGCACSTTAVSASSGYVAWSGTLGAFTVTNVNGRSKPSLGSQTSPIIDVGLSGLNTGLLGGVLTITWSDVGFDGLGPVALNETTSTFGSGMALYSGYVDPSNTLFGTANLVGTIGPTMGNGVLTGPGPTAERFSMTEVEVITLGSFALLINDDQLIGTPVPPLTLACSSASAQAGGLYNSSLVANGGVPAYAFSILSGSLPPGMTLNSASGLISGTPTATGSFNFVSQVMDSIGNIASTASTGGCTIAVTEQTPLSLSCSANTGQVGVPYSSSLVATGGLPPYNMFSITPANGLPAGLYLNAMTGAITGTPTASGTSNFTAQVVDSNGNTAMNSADNSCSIATAPEQLTLSCSAVTSGEVGVPFNSPAMTVTGGIAPYTYSVATGSLPAGLMLNASTGAITGTPMAAGTFTIQVTDANNVSSSSSCAFTIVAAPALTCSAVSSGEVGVAFNATAPTVAGGTAPFTFSLAPGSTLPAGLTLSPTTGAITGTPTAAGTFSIQVTDAKGVVAASTCPYTIVPAPTLTCSTVSSGEVGAAFNGTAPTVAGGTAPFTFSLAPGSSLPAGLTLSPSTGAITGTPTAAGTFSIQVTDANGITTASTCPYTIVAGPMLTCSAVTSGEVGAVFNGTAPTVTGGTAPYTFSLAPGSTMPGGLTLSPTTGAVTGMPTAPGSFSIQVTDAKGVTATGTCAYTIGSGPMLTCSAVTAGEVGAAFNGTAPTVTGGTAPYTFSLAPGSTMPGGLTLSPSTGAVTGTPTAPGSFSIQVTDAKGVTATGTCAYTIGSGPMLTCSAVTAGELGAAFNGTAPTVTGGTAPYTFSLAPGSAMPGGLTLSPTTGAVTGTPTAPGSFSIQVTDAKGVTATGTCAYTIGSGPMLTCSAVTAGEVGAAFNGTAPTVTGGTAPYTFSLAPGSAMPGGLTLSPTTGAVTGTPTAPGSFSIQVTDAKGVTATGTCAYTIGSGPMLTCSAATAGEVGVAFNGAAPTVTGGTAPYTFSLAPGSTMPGGLTLSPTTGAVTGTPTAPGSFSIQVTDSKGVTATGTCAYTIGSGPMLTCSAVTAGEVGVAFNSTAPTVTGGTAPYTFSLAPGSTMPGGLTLSPTTGAITGTPTALGSFSIQVTDAKGVTATGTCAYTIGSGPMLTCSAVTSGEVGAAFNGAAPTVTGGTAPYTFSLAPGSTMPGGLTLSPSTGAVTGTPTAPGSFSIQVTDAKGVTATGTCAYTIGSGPMLTCSAVTAGEVGAVFNGTAPTVTGGTAPYTFSLATGSLPPGLSLNASTGAITGTPTAAGTFTIQVKDSKGSVATGTCPYTISTPPTLTCSAVSSGEVGVALNSPAMTVSGGVAPYTFSVGTGTLPAGLTLNTSTGAITGTPTTTGSFTIKVTDHSGSVATTTCQFVVVTHVNLVCGTCGASKATTGTVYSASLSVSGGAGPYAYSITSGSLPPGLTLNASTGVISGTPTTVGTYTFTSQVVDNNGGIDTATCTIMVTAPPINLNCGTCGAGKATVGTAYTAQFSVTGGTAPFTYSITSGSLPPGLTLNTSTGAITGMPTTAGNYTFTTKVVDKNGSTDTTTCTIVVQASPVTLNCGPCSSSKAMIGSPYSATMTVTGGTAPYTYSIVSGSLPPGLTLNSSTGTISGAPTTGGTYTVTAQVVDKNGYTDTDVCTIVVSTPPVNLSCGACGSSNGKVGTPFSTTLALSGGTAPYAYSIQSGSLPPGLTLNASTGVISGTPTTAGSYTFTSKVVDKNGNSDTATCTIVVTGTSINLNCGTCGVSNATVGTSYSATYSVVGGTGPFTYSIISGSLPAGLTLNSSTGTISGTPNTAGSYTFTAKVVDKNGNTDTQACTIVVVTSPINLGCGSCGSGNGVVGTAYSSSLSVTGGTGPYTYSIISGSLPGGLTLNSSTGTISGTPTASGSFTFTSKVVDKNGNTDTQVCTIVVVAATLNLNCGTCGANQATVGVSYSATYSVIGGTGPFTYSIVSGSLPAGLTLNSSTGTIGGTPTTPGTYSFTAKVVDSNGKTDTQACTVVVVGPPITLNCGPCSAAKAWVGTAYSATMTVTGGTGPFTYSIVSGSLPAGLTLNSSTGTISGTPTTAGTYTVTAKVVDKNGNSDTDICTIVVGASPVSLGCGSCMSGKAYVGQAYSTIMSATGGAAPYSFSIISGALPAGLTLNASTGALTGTPTQQGTYTFTSKVVDKNGSSDTTTCTIVVEQSSGW